MQPLTTGGTVGDRTQQEEKLVKAGMRQSQRTKTLPALNLFFVFFFLPTDLTLTVSSAITKWPSTAICLEAIEILERYLLLK